MWPFNKSNNEDNEEMGYIIQPEHLEGAEGVESVGIGELTAIMLDYYCVTGQQPVDTGDEWKKGTEYEAKPTAVIPEDLDKEIKKAFLFQIKKFQK